MVRIVFRHVDISSPSLPSWFCFFSSAFKHSEPPTRLLVGEIYLSFFFCALDSPWFARGVWRMRSQSSAPASPLARFFSEAPFFCFVRPAVGD